MKYSRRMILGLSWIVAGAVLLILGILGRVDSYWSGMGSGLLAVGILNAVRYIRYIRDEDYKERTDIANKDERVRFISGRAWAWTGYCLVIIYAVASIVFRFLGREDIMMFCTCSVCLILVLYWVSYMILSRKY